MDTKSANKIEKTPVLKPLALHWKETDNNVKRSTIKVKRSTIKVTWAGAKCSEASKRGSVPASLGQGSQAGHVGGRAFGVT